MKKPKFSELQILAELDFSIPLMQLRGSTTHAPCHEVSVEPTLRDVSHVKKCRLFC